MNKLWSCLLSAACIAATTVWMPAQAAPSGGVRAPSPKADPNERVQSRLAEVIALLESDDLTAEEQAKARKTLQEIMAQLRTRTPTPSKASTPRRMALTPAEGAAGDIPGEGLSPRRAEPGGKGVYVEQGEPGEAPKARRMKAAAGQRGVYHHEGEVTVPPPMAPRTPKAPKADPKPGRAPRAALAPEGQDTPKTRRAYVDYGDAERAHEGAVKAYTDAAKVHAEKIAKLKGYRGVSPEETEKLRTEVEHARDYATRARAEAKELKAHAGALRAEIGAGESHDPDVRARTAPRGRVRAADDGEAEIRAMIDEMRNEMREIRSLMQKIRKQSEDDEDAPYGADYPTPPAVQPPGAAPFAPGLPSVGQPPAGAAPFAPGPSVGQPTGAAPFAPGRPSAGQQPPAAAPGAPFVRSHGGQDGYARQ